MKYKKWLKNKKVMIPAGMICVLLTIYLILCIMAGTGDFVSNTTINGIKVGQLTQSKAIETLNQQFEDDTEKLLIKMKAKDQTYTIDFTGNVSFDAKKGVEKIIKNKGNFLTRGYDYLMNHDFVIPVTIQSENQMKEAIQKSQILNYDTTQKTTYGLGKQKIIFKKGHNGERTTEKLVIQQIQQAFKDYDFQKEIQCHLEQTHLEDNEMQSIYKELATEAKNATLDKNNDYAIVDAKVGVAYDLEKAQEVFLKTKEGETFEVSAKITQPDISTEDLKENLFKDVLGSYSTYVSGSSVRKNNVRLAGIKCNSILLPGEEFSFNKQVGQRTTARGFGAAGAYRDGETVNEVGGGICQSSSTLYNAVLLSNLEVTLRSNHSYVSSYVPIGRDATVSWGGPDFKFKNNRDYPIKIEMSYSGSRLYCKILGTDVDGTYVKITSQKLSSTPFQTQYIDDPTLELGKEKVQTSGYTGAKAQSYRYVYDKNGNLISSKKEAYSVYKKRDKVVKRGTKPVEVTPIQPVPETPADNSTQESSPQTQPSTNQQPQTPIIQ